jgi:hypothetical protein
MYAKKEVGVQIWKRRCTPGSYKGEVARLHLNVFLRKQYFLYLKSLLAPPNAPLEFENGLCRP